MAEYSLLQQQLDPNVEGKISRDQFLRVMKHYFTARTRSAGTSEKLPEKPDSSTPRSSFSDRSQHSKPSELSEPEVVSERDPCDEAPLQNNASTHEADEISEEDANAESSEEDTQERDWQSEFHQLLRDPEGDDPVPRGLEMAAFLADFQHAATQAIEAIVNEIALDEIDRTIVSLPLDDDQVLATDYCDSYETLRHSVTKFVMSGLLVYVSHDESTHRVFGHQLRAARAIHDAIVATNATSLRVPLQCVVDYLGFRAFVIARSPINAIRILSSRMLLSCDRITQRTISTQLQAVWRQLGMFVEDLTQTNDSSHERMPHFVGAAAGLSTSVEGERDVCHLHNLFDVFPSEALSTHNQTWSLMRPEFVSQLGVTLPLHPQSSSVLLREDQRAILEQAIVTAEEHLRGFVLPGFVDAVEEQSSHICEGFELTEALHREGINARYLGLCFEAARSKHTRKLFLSEMIGRACKTELRVSLQAIFRDADDNVNRAYQSADSGDSDDRAGSTLETAAMTREALVADTVTRVVHEFFNLVFGNGARDSRTFWQERIVPRMQHQFVFSNAATAGEVMGLLPSDDLIHWPQVLQSVQYHTNVWSTDDDGVDFSSALPFPDAESFCTTPSARLLCETTYECQQLPRQTAEWVASGRLEDALENVKTQIAIVDTTPQRDSSPVLVRLLLDAADLCLLLDRTDEAAKFVTLALEASGQNSVARAQALRLLIRVKHAQSEPIEALRSMFAEALGVVNDHFGGGHPMVFDLFTTMIEIMSLRGDRDGVCELFHDIAVLARDCYGKVSFVYADIRRKQGEALMEASRFEHAASVLDEAFSVYDRLVHDNASDESIVQDATIHGASCLHLTAMLQAAQTSGSGQEAAFSTAVRALSMRRGVLPADHDDIVSSLLQLGALCVALGDLYRALEYYRPALAQLKAHPLDDTVTQLRNVSQVVLNVHIKSLPTDKLAIVEKTRTRFADVMESFDAALTVETVNDTRVPERATIRELELIRQVSHALLEQDPVDYVNHLIEKTGDEQLALRRERFTSGTIGRRECVAEDPTSPSRASLSPAPAAASSSRFASFAIGQSLPSSPPSSPSLLTSTSGETSTISLLSRVGAFSHGAQLAALLFLASLPPDE